MARTPDGLMPRHHDNRPYRLAIVVAMPTAPDDSAAPERYS